MRLSHWRNSPIFSAGLAAGLNIERFKKDMESDKVKARVALDQQQAAKLGVTSTPTVFLNCVDAKALCLRLDRFVQGNRDALALVRVPTEEEEQLRAIHRQREQLVKARKRLEVEGRSLMVNHGIEPVKNWWKPRTFAVLPVPEWMKELLNNTQPILLALQQKIRALTLQLQTSAAPFLFKMSQ
jgi:hypothetical protein